MYNIGLIELKYKFHGFSGLINMFSRPDVKLTIFTTNDVYNHVKNDLTVDVKRQDWVIKDDDETYSHFLKKIISICDKKLDLLIVNTIRILPFLFFRPACKKILAIYNINWWLSSTASAAGYLKQLRSIRFLFHKDLMRNCITGPLIRKKIISYYDGIILEYPPIRKYVLKNTKYNKKTYFLPNFPYNPEKFSDVHASKKNGLIHFIVPGKISKSRRDYDILYDVFTKLFGIYHQSFKLTLLGKPTGWYGKDIIHKFSSLKEKGCKIKYFKEFIPNSIYSEIMKDSDILISPVRKSFMIDTVKEYYTKSKGTGAISDSIYFAKPLILPSFCAIDPLLKNAIKTFNSNKSLYQLLSQMIENKNKLHIFQTESLNCYKNYSLNKCQEIVYQIIQNTDM